MKSELLNARPHRFEGSTPWLLALALAALYGPSLPGGFLNWDDPWLIQQSELLQRADLNTLRHIWADLSFGNRFALGAEYLPMRDMTLWLEARLWGLEPHWLRVTNLALYAGAVFALRAALHRTLRSFWQAEVAIWIFALHPVHVESVAWLAGRKDVLALFFVGLALWLHARRFRFSVLLVPLLCALAQLSKAHAIVAVAFLATQDLLQRRRPQWVAYALTSALALGVFVVQLQVGRLFNMSSDLAGGTRWTAAMTMGPVWLRYLGLLVWPPGLSLVQDVPVHTTWSLVGLLGYALVLASGVLLAAWHWRQRPRAGVNPSKANGSAVALAGWIWLWIPLLPVSQILFPLQNRMADRYLLFSVMGVALWLGAAVMRAPRVVGLPVILVLGAFALATLERAILFTDSRLVFADATAKTDQHPTAPYQLGHALEEHGDEGAARVAYQEALRRDALRVAPELPSEAGRRATNNLAKLHARRGDNVEAEAVLWRGRQRWPEDPKILSNLAEVVARQGRVVESDELASELKVRFPTFRP